MYSPLTIYANTYNVEKYISQIIYYKIIGY